MNREELKVGDRVRVSTEGGYNNCTAIVISLKDEEADLEMEGLSMLPCLAFPYSEIAEKV